MSSFSPLTGTLSGGSFYGIWQNTRPNRFPSDDSQTRNINSTTMHRDLCNSEIEFLDTQKTTVEEAYKKWKTGYLILVVLATLSSIALIVLWFQWILKISSQSLMCAELKRQIIWLSLNYLLGLLFQSLGLVSAYKKSMKGFIVFDILSLINAFAGVIMGVETVNLAEDSLDGCISDQAGSVHYYIYLTMMNCTTVLMMISVTIIMMHYMRKILKAQAKYQEYLLK